MLPDLSLSLLRQESRTCHGPVPTSVGGVVVPPGCSHLADGEFLLRADETLAFHYARGRGITVERGAGADPVSENLWLNGSVYAAMAAINGFMPIHASAVEHGGRAIAFTGPSGAGKSTLIAALGRRGLPMVCDDTLVLDIAGEAGIIAMPGHKRLKLAPASLALTGTQPQEPVGAETGKYYVAPPAGDWQQPLPLGALIFLENSDDVSIRHITGAERFTRLQDDHYTANLFALAGAFTPAKLFALRARLAQAIPMLCFSRPRDESRFAETTDAIAQAIARGLAVKPETGEDAGDTTGQKR